MSFQQKFIATCFLTAFMLGASWLLLAATILLSQPMDYSEQSKRPSVAGQKAEMTELFKEPIKLCSHDTKSGHKDCIPLEIVNSKAQSERRDNNQESDSFESASSSSGVKRALYAVTWEGTTEVMIVNDIDNSQINMINNPSLEETEDTVAIEPQNDEPSMVLDISDRPIPQEDNLIAQEDSYQLQNNESLLATYIEKDDVWESNNSVTESSPTIEVLSTEITTTEQLAEEETFDEPVEVNLEPTTSETNAQTDDGEGDFSESFHYYWFFDEETQE